MICTNDSVGTAKMWPFNTKHGHFTPAVSAHRVPTQLLHTSEALVFDSKVSASLSYRSFTSPSGLNGTSVKPIYIRNESCRWIGIKYLSNKDRNRKRFDTMLCKKSLCRFINGSGRVPPDLASPPGSGNSWVRGLLQQATGVCTGSIFRDKSLVNGGMIGENIQSGAVLLVKIHLMYHLNKSSPIILLLRNPLYALVSEWNRRVSMINIDPKAPLNGRNVHIEKAKPERFGEDPDWNEYIHTDLWLKNTKQVIINALRKKRKLLIVRYEDFVKDKAKEVMKVLDFIDYLYDINHIKNCLSSDFNQFKRHSTMTFDPYTSKQREVVIGYIKDLVEFVKNHLGQSYQLEDYVQQ